MIIKCDKCNTTFTDGQMQEPNRCIKCGAIIMSEAEITIISFIKYNYSGFEYVPLLSTVNVQNIKKQLVVKCLRCDEVLRMSGLGEVNSLSVESYCAGLIRGVLDRHVFKCEQKRVVDKITKKRNSFVPLPQRRITLED